VSPSKNPSIATKAKAARAASRATRAAAKATRALEIAKGFEADAKRVKVETQRLEADTKRLARQAPRCRKAWRDYGAALLEQRKAVPNKRTFGEWVRANGLDAEPATSHVVRSCAMWMAKHWPDVVKHLTTGSHHPVRVREECRAAGFEWAVDQRREKKTKEKVAPSSLLSSQQASQMAIPLTEGHAVKVDVKTITHDTPLPRYEPQIVTREIRCVGYPQPPAPMPESPITPGRGDAFKVADQFRTVAQQIEAGKLGGEVRQLIVDAVAAFDMLTLARTSRDPPAASALH